MFDYPVWIGICKFKMSQYHVGEGAFDPRNWAHLQFPWIEPDCLIFPPTLTLMGLAIPYECKKFLIIVNKKSSGKED